MSDDLERLNRLLDDLAAERAPADRASLSADDVELAETAALLKAASPERSAPDEGFIERLGAHLAAARTGVEEAHGAESAPRGGVSRRGLLGRIAATAAGLAVGAGAGEAVRGQIDEAAAAAPYSAPLVPWDRGGWVDTGHKAHGIAPGKAVRFRAGAVEGFLVNPGGGRPIYALSAACTHMGCLVTWLDSTSTFLCPCHGAQYNADGTKLSGIARRPLPRLDVAMHRDGSLYVWAVSEHPAVTTLLPYTKD